MYSVSNEINLGLFFTRVILVSLRYYYSFYCYFDCFYFYILHFHFIVLVILLCDFVIFSIFFYVCIVFIKS